MGLSRYILRHTFTVGIVGTLVIWLGTIVMKSEIAMRQAPNPEAILVLGGLADRDETAAKLAKNYPTLPVWISSGGRLPEAAYTLFEAAGVSRERVYLDYRATDTVTNFTTLVTQFKHHNIRHLYVVTSDFHMPRAQVIGTIVLGHNGMTLTPVSVPTNEPAESWLRVARDGSRSLLWTMTGRTGEHVGRKLEAKLSQITLNPSNNKVDGLN